ncbi:hypothetical protein HAX54_028081 [Datura stramonium]|uniref:Uncharacterized protein n=1 Tax=Datura stramonium TaxID=4076 RepID=A0ABS8V634_DATST|nr:hypothetical protein [Datura stramonium]
MNSLKVRRKTWGWMKGRFGFTSQKVRKDKISALEELAQIPVFSRKFFHYLSIFVIVKSTLNHYGKRSNPGSNDSYQVNEDLSTEEMDDDDDNLIINVVAGANDKTTMFKDPTEEAIAAIQNSLSKESRLATDKQKQGRKMSSNRKRKAPSEDEDDEVPNSQRSLHGKTVSASSGATFSVLDILPSAIPGKEMQSGSDGVNEVSKDEEISDQHEELDKVESEDEVSTDEEVSDQHEEIDKVESEDVIKDENVSDQHEEDKIAEDPTDNLDGPVDIYVRGAAWRQNLHGHNWFVIPEFSIVKFIYGHPFVRGSCKVRAEDAVNLRTKTSLSGTHPPTPQRKKSCKRVGCMQNKWWVSAAAALKIGGEEQLPEFVSSRQKYSSFGLWVARDLCHENGQAD